MLTTTILLTLLGQMDMTKSVPMDKIQLPFTGGQREIVLGLQPKEKEYLGLYADRQTDYAKGNGVPPDAPPINWLEVRVGYTSWSVANYVNQGKPTTLLQTEAMYKQELQVNKRIKFDLTNRATRSFWVDDKGNITKETGTITVPQGTYAMSAEFHGDEYDLFLKTPRGESRTTMNLAVGIDKFNAIFTPMIKDKKVVQPSKEFYIVDTLTGAPVKCTAKVGGKFGQRFASSGAVIGGQYVDIDFAGNHQQVYVSDDGLLVRVLCSRGLYLNMESTPLPKSLTGG